MRVRVLYFGALKDVFGGEDEMVELAEGSCVAELMAVCRGRFAGRDGLWESIAVAVNQEYARVDVELKDGDEVALLPPVSGGCGWVEGKARG
jgi:molybdopterin converting factor subunit 1